MKANNKGVYTRPRQSFGPAVYQEPDGTFSVSCVYCVFLRYKNGPPPASGFPPRYCDYKNIDRDVPNPTTTPEWCEMRESMLQDVKDAVEKEAARKARK